ncbi:unnamed protein product [Paramecium sonneborni]|uniref:EGF-like domain-containing protein n=1 Tax=Paramecium sonneborni TaxID=65129 RepID=A0A8S1QW07_9CILI|nr:unnamed protein product [Paramecium sonneborni]
MNFILYGICILTLYLQQGLGSPVWTLLNDDLQPISTNQRINQDPNNFQSYQYQSIYNITTNNIGYQQSRIVIELQITVKQIINLQQQLLEMLMKDNFSNCYCLNMANDNQNYIFVLDQISKQQNYIEIVIKLNYEHLIKNLQVFVLKCHENCALCHDLECLKCQDQYNLNLLKQCQKIDNFNKSEDLQTQYYLGQHYSNYLLFEKTKLLLEIQNGYLENNILNQITTNRSKEIIINQNTYAGPFFLNEGLEYPNLNLTFINQINIRVEFTIFLLYEIYDLGIIYYSINGFENQFYISQKNIVENQNCMSTSFQNCKILKFYKLFYNLTKLDSLKIEGSFSLLQQNVAWAFGDFKVFQIQSLQCKYKVHQSGCFLKCPLGTIDDNNFCLDRINHKFIVLHNFEYFNNMEFLMNNHIYLTPNQTFYKYDSITYELFQRNLQIEIKLKKQIEISFKLIIVDASVNESLIINFANFSYSFTITDLEIVKAQIGAESLNDYRFEFKSKTFELENYRGFSKLQIIRKGCPQLQCFNFISELLVISPKCSNDCEECNQESGCIAQLEENMNCPQGYIYSNFECQQCEGKCNRCNKNQQCLECKEGFILFSGECYLQKNHKNSRLQPLRLCRDNPLFNINCIESNCDGQFQVRYFNLCICQDGSILNQDYQCIPCKSQCLTCIDSTARCTSCNPSENRILQSGSCICQEGYYEQNGNQSCQKCLPKCKQCQYKEFICTECYLSQYKVLNQNDCICQEGYYHDFINDICLQCKNTCKSCQNYNTCIDCDIQQFRVLTLQNQCICQQGYYLSNQICIPCHYTCLECIDSSEFNKCIKCSQGRKRKNMYMDYFECVCQDGYFDIGQQQCQNCQLLNNPTIDHYCYTNCGDGIIQWNEECDNGVSIQRNGCHQCKLTQSKCQIDICQICNQKECVQCFDGYYLRNDYSCDQCSPICKTCKYNPYNCITCAENNHQCSNCLPEKGYHYHQNSCQSICGDGYLTQEEQCDDGNLLDNDGCNSNCQIEYHFLCGNICINKPIMHIQLQENKLDKYYSNLRHYEITILNYQYNIDKEQFHLSYKTNKQITQNLYNNCGELNYTINKSSLQKFDNQKFFVQLNLNQSCIDQYLNFVLFNNTVVIYEKQILILNYFTIYDQFFSLLDYVIKLFDLLLNTYNIIFITNFFFIKSNKYLEILFLFQLISYQKKFKIQSPKYFESFQELFIPYQMIIPQKIDFINEKTQQEFHQKLILEEFSFIFKQHLIIIISIAISSSIRLIIIILMRINKNQSQYSYKNINQKFIKYAIYSFIYFINYFTLSLYIVLTQNNNTIQKIMYVISYIACQMKIQTYLKKQKLKLRFIVLLNTSYILIIMMMAKIKIYQLLLASLIIAAKLVLSIIDKHQFELKYKLLLGNLWVTHFFFVLFELYSSSIQKHEQFNQLLGGVIFINYFIILFFLILDILKNSLKIIKTYYQKIKQRKTILRNNLTSSLQIYHTLTQSTQK